MIRSPRLFIAVSVLLNLVLAGVIVGQTGHHVLAIATHGSMEEFGATLSDARRAQLEAAVQKTQDDTRALQLQVSDAREKAARLMQAGHFDRQAYLAQARHMHELKTQLANRRAMALADIAAACTPEERTALADILRRPKPSLWPPIATPR